MKPANIFFSTLLVAFVASGAFAQDEYDDMYFNSKDRAKIIASRNTLEPRVEKKIKAKAADDEINPTDSYSARNVNPEYTSRSNSESAQADNEDYFISNYNAQTQSQFNNLNRNYNNWYNDPWYSSAYYANNINRWNSPYYGGYNSPYSSPWYDPYYNNGWNNGWSSSFSLYGGNSWNYGWGMNYGYGCPYNNYWGNSWYSPYSSLYYPYNSWYSPYGYYGYSGYGYGSPVTIIVNEGNSRGPVYGKRSTRGTSFVQNNSSGDRGRSSYTTRSTTDANSSSGRTVTRKQDEYYQRTQSTNSAVNTQQDSRTTTRQNRSSSWSTGNNNSSWSSPSNNSSWSNTGRSSGSTGGATRSHSGGSGSGSNGRTRGRN